MMTTKFGILQIERMNEFIRLNESNQSMDSLPELYNFWIYSCGQNVQSWAHNVSLKR